MEFKMATEAQGDLLNTIGQHVADVLSKVPDNVFVFIEAGDQWCGGAIFENLPDQVIYHDFDDGTDDLILSLWEAAEPDKKWTILLYDIKDGRFSVEYIYPDQLDPDESSIDQRERFLVARYGDKPVIYPEMEEGEWDDLTEKDLLGDGPNPDDLNPDALNKGNPPAA
jgi:hypothetical protein